MNSSRTVIHEDKIVVPHTFHKGDISTTQTNQSSVKAYQKNTDTRPVLLYIITRADWEDAQQSLYSLCEYFADDYQIHVVYGAYEYFGNNIFREQLSALDITLHPFDTLTDETVLFYEVQTIWQLAKLVHKLDPVVIHSYDAKTSMFVGIVARWIFHHRARLIASIYEVVDTQSASRLEQGMVRWLRAQSYGMADALIVSDEYLQSQAQTQFTKIDRIHLICPGIIEIDFISPARKREALARDESAPLAAKIRDPQTILLGNIAPLEPEHNPGYIIQALNQLKSDEHQFVYVHYGDGSQRTLMEHEIEQFSLGDCVILKGRESMAQRYLQVFDIVVHPSSQPGVPQLVQSAGLAQRALVLSPTPGLEHAVEDDKEVAFVPARDAQALGDKLSYLIEHPERRRSMGTALGMRVRADYQAGEMRRRTRKLYGVE